MFHFSLTSLVIALFLVCPGLSQNHAPQKKASAHRVKVDHPSKPSNEPWGPHAEVDPPAPLLPFQQPAVQPRVSYRDGLLTIEALNCSLASVITAIHNKTGIAFEGLQGAADRVAVRTGPAPVGEVLTELLRGSQFDYMIIGREDSPNIVQRVILTPKGSAGAAAGVANIPQNANQQQVDEEEVVGEPVTVQSTREDQQLRPPPPPLVRQQQSNGSMRTPEQMLEEMRQQDLQRRQQQQKTNKPDDPPL
jgi:hypothetical protein